MEQGFGQEKPPGHRQHTLQRPARYLVLVSVGGVTMARLYDAAREQVAEIDGALEEVAGMTRGLAPITGALGPEWDKALAGQNTAERREAVVYELPV